jgi:hypothetical protein
VKLRIEIGEQRVADALQIRCRRMMSESIESTTVSREVVESAVCVYASRAPSAA